MFTDYLDLRTAVIDQVGNPERVAPAFPTIIKLAEAKLNRTLRTRHQITERPVTIEDGSGWLPSDLIEVIGIYDGTGRELIGGTLRDREAGMANFVLKSSQIYAPDGEYTVQYYAAIDSLANDNQMTNWLLESAPDVYFWTACESAAKWTKDIEGAVAYAKLSDDAIADFRGFDETERYSRARVRVSGVNP
jgi:hypothetical protein